jgi:hypothetical protein
MPLSGILSTPTGQERLSSTSKRLTALYSGPRELNIPEKEKILEVFIGLSKRLGPARVVWRYDPILLTDKINTDWHIENFNYLASALKGYTHRCVISFVDMYKKCRKNLKSVNVREPDDREMKNIASSLRDISIKNRMAVQTCAEKTDFPSVGVGRGKCIDDRLVSEITGREISAPKDRHQRKECGCVESVDIGAYNTCPHLCLYCYANFDAKTVEKNAALHRTDSLFLV